VRDSFYNAHGHKLRFPPSKKAQFVTALGIRQRFTIEHAFIILRAFVFWVDATEIDEKSLHLGLTGWFQEVQ
jgi:hypothetical protein